MKEKILTAMFIVSMFGVMLFAITTFVLIPMNMVVDPRGMPPAWMWACMLLSFVMMLAGVIASHIENRDHARWMREQDEYRDARWNARQHYQG